MKRDFDFYEFVGYLMPGAFILFLVSMSVPTTRAMFLSKDLSVGVLSIFVLMSYVAGHLVQAFSTLWEEVFWKWDGGWPSAWVLHQNQNLLSNEQIARLPQEIKQKLGIEIVDLDNSITPGHWRPITSQMYAAVKSSDRATRIDIFSGNYLLLRGIASGFIIVEIGIPFVHTGHVFLTYLGVMILQCLALHRMRRFGIHYARELYVQFLQLPTPAI